VSRPLRIEYPDAYYHVMNRGRRSEKIFFDKSDYLAFIDLLREAIELWGVELYSYTLIPNHYHILLKTPLGNLSRFMRHVDGVYTQRFNKNHNAEGSLFKGRYKSILVEADNYLLQIVKYIHRNSLKARIVDNIDNYKWCSHKAYLSNNKNWSWVKKEFVLSMLTNIKKNQRNEYLEFVNEKETEEVFKILERSKLPSILGSDNFIKLIKEKYSEEKGDLEVPDSFYLLPDIELIKSIICKYYGVNEDNLNRSIRGIVNEPRNVAVYLSRILRKDTLVKIGKEFSLNRYSSVSSIISRLDKMKESDSKFSKRVEEIKKSIIKSQT